MSFNFECNMYVLWCNGYQPFVTRNSLAFAFVFFISNIVLSCWGLRQFDLMSIPRPISQKFSICFIKMLCLPTYACICYYFYYYMRNEGRQDNRKEWDDEVRSWFSSIHIRRGWKIKCRDIFIIYLLLLWHRTLLNHSIC